MNVNTVSLCGGFANRVVGFVDVWDYTFTQLASLFGITEDEAQTLYVRSAKHVRNNLQGRIDEINRHLEIIAARA